MTDFQIFSDGSCDLKPETALKYNIKLIPFYVSLDHENYLKEVEELSVDDFYSKMIGDHIYPKTSLPSVQDYINAFTPSLENGIDVICYTITDTLSGSFQSATTAKIMLEETYPNSKIYIVNSWLATGALALLVMEASKMQSEGLNIDKVYELSEELKKTSRIIFMVGSLDYLEKGGRVGKLAALSGSILNIKPLIELKNSEIGVAGVSRSRKKGLKKLSEASKTHFIKSGENIKDYIFTIGTTNTQDEVQPFMDMLKTDIADAEFIEPFNIGATISTHTGPDTIGVCFIKKSSAVL